MQHLRNPSIAVQIWLQLPVLLGQPAGLSPRVFGQFRVGAQL